MTTETVPGVFSLCTLFSHENDCKMKMAVE